MATPSAATAVKSSPPPAPPTAPVEPEAPPVAAAEAPQPRPLRPLPASQIGLAEHLVRHHVVTLPIGTTFGDALLPEFYANVSDRLRVCDRIDLFDTRGTFYAELLVRFVSQSRPMQGTKGGARVHLLRYVEFDLVEQKARPIELAAEWRGPSQMWCAVRIADNAIIKSHMESRELADRHIASMAVAMI
jgi:hypothetical protein